MTEEKPKKKEKKEEKVVEIPKTKVEKNKDVKQKEKIDEKKEELEKKSEESKEKKPVEKKETKKKKTKVIVNSFNLPVSTKYSTAICKFIKGKKIENAINDLEKVIAQKKPVPMKGEIPHKKEIMSGRYPKKTSKHFIKLLKSLLANANFHEIENPIIKEATANIGSRPYGRFGRIRRKRTHIKITAEKIKEKHNGKTEAQKIKNF